MSLRRDVLTENRPMGAKSDRRGSGANIESGC
eukprot:COSAG02_NODE_810_length_16920_cov_466.145286_7_plen_32_part_00